LYGNYEDYVINDLREFIRTNFRVLTSKNFQFIHGHSMGGFGSAYLAARHPDLFRASCPSAGAFTWPDTLLNAWRTYLYNENNGYHFNYNAGQYTQIYFTLCGGFSPDTAMPPWYFESLYDTLGHVVESVYSRWKGFMSADMIRDISPENNLAFFLICGIEDELSFFPSNLEFTDTLQKYGRHYRTAWHNSGHSTFDPVSHQKMFHWVDSLIMEAYSHLDVPEANQDPALLNLICFPNPFSTEVQFTFTLPHACQVTLQMFHVDGKFVAEVARGEMGTGGHQITWSDTGILPGVYVCRLHAGEQTVVKRIIKL
ncbi:MAG: T9SS type A sorting domain-containing protein, partial [Bacteroidales bacterium]|nr:T9SS type A sorting domain-containing protein [Bacteroidales bacterium]